MKRRFVLGIREVTKHLKSRKIKCIIISPNLERIQSKGKSQSVLVFTLHSFEFTFEILVDLYFKLYFISSGLDVSFVF